MIGFLFLKSVAHSGFICIYLFYSDDVPALRPSSNHLTTTLGAHYFPILCLDFFIAILTCDRSKQLPLPIVMVKTIILSSYKNHVFINQNYPLKAQSTNKLNTALVQAEH